LELGVAKKAFASTASKSMYYKHAAECLEKHTPNTYQKYTNIDTT
jgi:hypothetical protein